MNSVENKEFPKSIVLFNATISLDGFIAGPDDDMDWIFKYHYPNDKIKEITNSIGSLLVGKRTYKVGKKNPEEPTGKAYGGAWSDPEFILTHNAPLDEFDPNKVFINDSIENAVKIAREGF